MAELLHIARESVYRIEREQTRAAKSQVQYAAALGQTPDTLWKPPAAKMSDEETQLIADVIVEVLRRRRRNP
jgi:hypothetical protein